MKSGILSGVLLACLATTTWAAEHTVEMKNAGAGGSMVFEPAVLNVAVGDTVHFVPTSMGHNSESVAGLSPANGTIWKGGMSQKVSVTLDKEGVYVYQCMPHSIMAMVGVLVAGKPTNIDTVKENAKALTTKFVMNKDRLDTYLAQVK